MSYRYDSPASELLTNGRGFAQPHRPAFWLMLVALAAGAIIAVMTLAPVFGTFTPEAGIAYLGVVAFAALFLWVISGVSDLDPKPASMVAAAFAAGALSGTGIAGFLAGPLETVFSAFLSDPDLITAFDAATGEEYVKSLLVLTLFLLAPWWFRRPIDGVIFAALVGLGFQILEDVLYVASAFGDTESGVLEVFFNRVFITGLFSHVMFSGLFGVGFGYAVTASTSIAKRIGAVAGGFAVAWLGHFWWDHPAFDFLGDYGTIGLVGYVLVKGLPFFLIFVFFVVKLVKDERTFFYANAKPEIEEGTLTADDLVKLETFGGRIKTRREPKGHEARFRAHHLMRAQLDLVRLHVHGFTEPEVLDQQRAFIEDLKH